MARWLNIIGYQATWFAAVIGAARQHAWPGVLAACVFVTTQWLWSDARAADTRALLLAIALGVTVDGSLAASGLVDYAAATPALGAPLWILALWAAFALTLNHSLAFLRGRPWLAVLLGGIGAPLAYSAAAREFDAVQFRAPSWHACAALGAAWAVAMLLFYLVTLRRPSAAWESSR